MPFLWVIDPEARSLDVFTLGPEGYSLVVHASGDSPVGPRPFPDLAVISASLFPQEPPGS